MSIVLSEPPAGQDAPRHGPLRGASLRWCCAAYVLTLSAALLGAHLVATWGAA